jgi:hypothetical protein
MQETGVVGRVVRYSARPVAMALYQFNGTKRENRIQPFSIADAVYELLSLIHHPHCAIAGPLDGKSIALNEGGGEGVLLARTMFMVRIWFHMMAKANH